MGSAAAASLVADRGLGSLPTRHSGPVERTLDWGTWGTLWTSSPIGACNGELESPHPQGTGAGQGTFAATDQRAARLGVPVVRAATAPWPACEFSEANAVRPRRVRSKLRCSLLSSASDTGTQAQHATRGHSLIACATCPGNVAPSQLWESRAKS